MARSTFRNVGRSNVVYLPEEKEMPDVQGEGLTNTAKIAKFGHGLATTTDKLRNSTIERSGLKSDKYSVDLINPDTRITKRYQLFEPSASRMDDMGLFGYLEDLLQPTYNRVKPTDKGLGARAIEMFDTAGLYKNKPGGLQDFLFDIQQGDGIALDMLEMAREDVSSMLANDGYNIEQISQIMDMNPTDIKLIPNINLKNLFSKKGNTSLGSAENVSPVQKLKNEIKEFKNKGNVKTFTDKDDVQTFTGKDKIKTFDDNTMLKEYDTKVGATSYSGDMKYENPNLEEMLDIDTNDLQISSFSSKENTPTFIDGVKSNNVVFDKDSLSPFDKRLDILNKSETLLQDVGNKVAQDIDIAIDQNGLGSVEVEQGEKLMTTFRDVNKIGNEIKGNIVLIDDTSKLLDKDIELQDTTRAIKVAQKGAEFAGKEALEEGLGKSATGVGGAVALADKDSSTIDKIGGAMDVAGALGADTNPVYATVHAVVKGVDLLEDLLT